MKRFLLSKTLLFAVLVFAECAISTGAQTDRPAFVAYKVPDSPPRVLLAAAKKQSVQEGMTLRELVNFLGPALMAPNEGVGFITWYFDDGSELRVLPKESEPGLAPKPFYWGARDETPRVPPDAFYNGWLVKKNKTEIAIAITESDHVIALHPKDPKGYIARGMLKKAVGDLVRAEDTSHYPAVLEEAIADFSKAIALAPKNVDAYIYRGDAYKARDADDKAAADFSSAIKISPNHERAYVYLADVRIGSAAQAIADYNTAVTLNPGDAFAWFARGCAKKRNDDAGGAILDFDHAIARDPKFATAYNYRGIVKLHAHDWVGAKADFIRVIELEPLNILAYVHCGDAMEGNGDMKGAVAIFTRAIEAGPADQTAYYAYLSRASAKRAMGDTEGAAADSKRAVNLNPARPAATPKG